MMDVGTGIRGLMKGMNFFIERHVYKYSSDVWKNTISAILKIAK